MEKRLILATTQVAAAPRGRSGQCHQLNVEGWYTFTIIAAQPGLREIPSHALIHTTCGGWCFRSERPNKASINGGTQTQCLINMYCETNIK